MRMYWGRCLAWCARVVGLSLFMAAAAAAQSSPAAYRTESAVAATVSAAETLAELQSLMVAQRERLAELSDALDRRTRELTDLEARFAALKGVVDNTAGATVVNQIVPRPAETPAVTPATRFDFYSDSLVRLATLHQEYAGCNGCPDRTIERVRLRFGVEGHVAPGLRAVLGLSVGELNDPNTVFQTLGGNLGRKAATWDRGYLAYRPTQAPWMELTAGKFPYTWVRSSMTFDVDFYPEGASERVSFNTKGPVRNITAQAMQIEVNEQPNGPDTQMLGTQGSVTLGLNRRVETRAIISTFDISRPELVLRAQLDGSDVGVRNTNAVIERDGADFYASGFRYVNTMLENTITTASAAWPVVVTGELQKNVRAASTRNTGQSLRLDVGRQQRQGDWGFGWHLFRVEQDAIVSALGESDWRAPSNVLQHRFSANYTWHEHVQTLFTWYRGRTLDTSLPGAVLTPGRNAGDNDPWANRLYFDVLYRF